MAALRQVVSAISIHALLAESDRTLTITTLHCVISIHALLAESDTYHDNYNFLRKFLSTLSLRRATSLR